LKKSVLKSDWAYVIFFILVLLSRIPFLFQGFGLDADSWGVALSARSMSYHMVYEASRFPGYPVHELLCTLAGGESYFLSNFLTAFISSLGILFFALTLKALRFKYIFLASAALAAVPVVYINSIITIDYTLALAFILIGLYFAIKNQPVLAGFFLGIAIGCRITSGAMLLPFAIMIARNDGFHSNLVRILKLMFATMVIGLLFYIPAYIQYGFSFLTYYDTTYPEISRILYKLSFDVWGTVGFVGLLLATGMLFLPDRITAHKFLFPRSVNEKYVVAWLIAIDLYIVAFLKLPLEAGYLIPIIPFVILIFGKYLYDKAFIVFSVLLIISPFIISISPKDRPDSASFSSFSKETNFGNERLVIDLLNGPIFSYESRRQHAVKNMDSLILKLNGLENLSLIISGKWYNQIQFEKEKKLDNVNVSLVDYINEESLLRYLENGYDIYFLPREDEFNLQKYHYDLKEYEGILMTFN